MSNSVPVRPRNADSRLWTCAEVAGTYGTHTFRKAGATNDAVAARIPAASAPDTLATVIDFASQGFFTDS